MGQTIYRLLAMVEEMAVQRVLVRRQDASSTQEMENSGMADTMLARCTVPAEPPELGPVPADTGSRTRAAWKDSGRQGCRE